MNITIWHNPACGTSRKVLAALHERGLAPKVIEYLKTPPSRQELKGLLARAGIGVRDVLREKGTPYAELGLDNPALSDEQLYDAIEKHPILMNRPIVSTDKGVALCRPMEKVFELL